MEDSLSAIPNPKTHEHPQMPSLPEKEIGNHGLTKSILRLGNTWPTPFPGDEVESESINKLKLHFLFVVAKVRDKLNANEFRVCKTT